ncbi:MAG: hypothetical protein AB4040_10440 [Synechococcus sp.]
MATFQLSTQDLIEMQRELNRDRRAELHATSFAAFGFQDLSRLRQELQRACSDIDLLLAECDRLADENHHLKALTQGHDGQYSASQTY